MDVEQLLHATPKYAVVDIRWEDSQGSSEWRKVRGKDRLVAGCRTVGMFESVTRDAVVVIQSRDKANKHAHGILSIPLAAVKKVKVIS